jgi:hypothetical protein
VAMRVNSQHIEIEIEHGTVLVSSTRPSVITPLPTSLNFVAGAIIERNLNLPNEV